MVEQMAQQEGGWPLGLHPLNARVGLTRNLDFSGSLSLNTHISGSPSSSSITSSDLDTESTGSFFHDRSITLGSLIGITSILELPGRSLRSTKQDNGRRKKSSKAKPCFSLCTRTQLSGEMARNAPSLGHFLEEERRARNAHMSRGPITYEVEGLPESQSGAEPNSLFSNGFIAPPQGNGNGSPVPVGNVKRSNTWPSSIDEGGSDRGLSHDNSYSFLLMLPCMGGQSGR